ncbi:MAG: nucleotidyl transferase AbiEii/AbiGii toxin family protein [Spirochaetales bacterium]|jgi:predicted nucleotidyltransferase component of viral defense system|nr:nucleotidyl transferase AbiEii/AbiGii toxin family protein [Spirochaetales bacterium]
MIELDSIYDLFDPAVGGQDALMPYMVKAFIHCQILEFLSHNPHVSKLSLIGGTNLRLVGGIDRFSEDLDFDCNGMSGSEFLSMTDSVVQYLSRCGYRVESVRKERQPATGSVRSLYFPHLRFSGDVDEGYRDAVFTVKIRGREPACAYDTQPVFIRSMGYFFPFPAPPMEVLTAMKLSALLSRAKGRDFYDALFLLQRSEPSYAFLEGAHGIGTKEQLRTSLLALVDRTDLEKKRQDFEHLLFDKSRSGNILFFGQFIEEW